MKIALINLRDEISKNEYPQLGLLYLASVLRDVGYVVDFFDATAENETFENVFNAVKTLKPDICGFSLYTGGLLKQYEFIKAVKENLLGCKVVAGGPHVSALPQRTMEECKYIDYLVCGEGEVTVVELLNAVENGQDLSQVRGVYYKDDTEIITTGIRDLIKDLDTIPFPAYDLIVEKGYRYHNRKMEIGSRVAAMVSSRGCPWNCAFCYKKTFGTVYRRRSPKNVVDEIILLMDKYGFNDITFVDDLFPTNRRWLREFCQNLNESSVKVPWKCLARVDTINKEDTKMMKDSGCYGIEFGIESGNEEVLKDINKKITVTQVRRAFREAREVGLMTSGFFIFGNRLDTEKTIMETMDLAREIKPDYCGFAVLLPFPGTAVYQLLDEDSKYKWEIFGSYYGYKHPISVCSIGADKLQKFGKQASAEYYGRLRYLFDNIIFSKNALGLKMYQLLFFGYFMIKKIILWIKNERVFTKITAE